MFIIEKGDLINELVITCETRSIGQAVRELLIANVNNRDRSVYPHKLVGEIDDIGGVKYSAEEGKWKLEVKAIKRTPIC